MKVSPGKRTLPLFGAPISIAFPIAKRERHKADNRAVFIADDNLRRCVYSTMSRGGEVT